jgi:hypothetical protein
LSSRPKRSGVERSAVAFLGLNEMWASKVRGRDNRGLE